MTKVVVIAGLFIAAVVFLYRSIPSRWLPKHLSGVTPAYDVSELMYMGATHTFSYVGFNNSGHLAGSVWGVDGKYQGAILAGGEVREIGTFPGCVGSRVYGMNDSDIVVGASYKNDNHYSLRTTVGVIWNGQRLEELPPLRGMRCSRAWGVTNSGLAVGNSYTPLNEERDAVSIPVEWINSSPHALPLPSGAMLDTAYDANDSGQIVGTVTLRDGSTEGCLWQQGRTTVLPPIAGDKNLVARSINSRGVVLSVSQGKQAHAVLWRGGTPEVIGGISGVTRLQPLKINDSDVFIVNDPDTPGYPFIWHSDRGFERLARLIDSRDGYALWQALGLNNRGQIAVGGRLKGQRTSIFLLTPK